MVVTAWSRASLSARFAAASAVILVAGAALLGVWITREIETSVIRRVAADGALYVEALISPHVQRLDEGALPEQERRDLTAVLERASLARGVVSIKIWDTAGRIAWATDPHLVGTSPASSGLRAAVAGSVASHRSDLSEEENAYERALSKELIETYIPIRAAASDEVVAVAEFYQPVDLLEGELQRARLSTWAVIGSATALMYALLAGMVSAGSRTIERQRRDLETAVTRLSAATRRLREVSAARSETEEAILRRIAREIHDGLAQDIASALLSLDEPSSARAARVRSSLESALAEVRALATGLGAPDLAASTIGDVIEHACAAHERKTGHEVARELADLRGTYAPTVKAAAFRIVQESLSNAFRHAPGSRARVRARETDGWLTIECDDDGPGIPVGADEGPGIRGMRERAELLGGRLSVTSSDGRGTLVTARLPAGAS